MSNRLLGLRNLRWTAGLVPVAILSTEATKVLMNSLPVSQAVRPGEADNLLTNSLITESLSLRVGSVKDSDSGLTIGEGLG